MEGLKSNTLDPDVYRKEYLSLKAAVAENLRTSQVVQIDKDLDRTFPQNFFFGKGQEGREQLKELLQILALKYQGILGYVQGMNFLVANFLYHASPEVSLVLCTALIEHYQLCDVLKDNLEGLHARNRELDQIIQINLPALHKHITSLGVKTEMFTTSWVIGLFSHIIELEDYGIFLDHFFLHRWTYFYKLVIHILHIVEP